MVPRLPIIVITAFGNMETAIEAMKEGACYFLAKPFEREHLLLAVEKALGGRCLTDEAETLEVHESEVKKGIVCVFPKRGGSLWLQSAGPPAPEPEPSRPGQEKRSREGI
jgi:DNA-binding NarL/FixJ family response regulator